MPTYKEELEELMNYKVQLKELVKDEPEAVRKILTECFEYYSKEEAIEFMKGFKTKLGTKVQ